MAGTTRNYEGIIVVHKIYTIKLSGLESTYAQIHPRHSDWLTPGSELAKQLKFVYRPEVLIPDKHFGIGVEYRLPSITFRGQTFSNIVIPSAPYIFDIRGAIYDVN